jgi:hypothetical protein
VIVSSPTRCALLESEARLARQYGAIVAKRLASKQPELVIAIESDRDPMIAEFARESL